MDKKAQLGLTAVFDLRDGSFTGYSLSPFDAVVAAHAQFELRDYNTWTYGKYHDKVIVRDSLKPGIICVTLGNMTTLAKKEDLHVCPWEPIIPDPAR